MRFISGLIGLAFMIALVQTAISPKTTYSRMAGGGWIGLHPDGTYTAYPRSHPQRVAPPETVPGRDI